MSSSSPSSKNAPKTGHRRLIILGSTGSIGVNTLQVVDHLRKCAQNDGNARSFEVVGLAAGTNADLLIEQAKAFNVAHVAVADLQAAAKVRIALPNVQVLQGPDAALQLVETVNATDVTAAVVGSAGLPATMAAARKGLTIGLANKETLVAAGGLVTPLVRKHGAKLIPVDSEHSAIFQCLTGQATHAVKRIVLTASGGPFRCTDAKTMHNATVEQALKHPTWTMGRKITIDSATMMNKALEIIEAHWLFDLPAEKISVIIHPQSVAHSFVEFEDHSILAQLGSPDMKTPIQYALTYPDRPVGCSQALDWSTLSKLDFEQPDMEKFRAIPLAYDVIRAGGTAGAIFNAANEAAVEAFFERKILLGRIVELVGETLSALDVKPLDSLETALAADRQARAFVNQRVNATMART